MAEAPSSDCIDWACDTSSDLPELGGGTVLEKLSLETEDPQETAPAPSVVPTQTSEVRVERMKFTPQQRAVINEGIVGASWQRKSRENPKATESAVPHGGEIEIPKRDSRPDVFDGIVDAGEGPCREHSGLPNASGESVK